MNRKLLAIAMVFLCGLSAAVVAQEAMPENPLANTAQEERARGLFRELRCEVCAGQTIADSNAVLAQDMRGMVREKVAAGESNDEILSFFSQRYGDGILMRPPLNSGTVPLWWGPLFIFLLGGWFLVRYFARKKRSHF